MKEQWILRRRPYKDLAEKLMIDPMIARLVRNRVDEKEAAAYLDREGPLHDPFQMKDLPEAVQRILWHRQKGHAVQIVGDYDVDGVTSASILYIGLTHLGIDAHIRIPDRVKDGYGIRPNMVDEAVSNGCQLILTCDNGIREFETMQHAVGRKIEVIVTDHHEITKDEKGRDLLPEASLVINPHRQDCEYPFEGLCGAGVAFKLMQGLYARLNEPMPPSLIGYAALGTVCDLMELKGENRRIVYQGLKEWNRRPPVGIRAMMEASGIQELQVYHCGYVIGPMINAGGRLRDQQTFIQILLTEDEDEAIRLAEQLKVLNQKRQQMTQEGVEKAIQAVESRFRKDQVKVVHLPDIHESIAGLVAGKLKEKYYRPVFVLSGQETVVKGSGRSIPAYDMFRHLQMEDALMERYGGHPMAAGLSIARDHIDAFRTALNQHCGLTEEDCIPQIIVDAPLPIHQASLALAEAMDVLSPYGTGNPSPVFAATGLLLTHLRIMGKSGNAARLTLVEQGRQCEAITFRMETLEQVLTEKFGEKAWQALQNGETVREGLPIDVLYTLGVNEYRGLRNVQCTVCNLR